MTMTELKSCPFCDCQMQFRKALWPSDGDVDSIIHACPTPECGMADFSIGTTDESVIAAWNARPSPAPLADVERVARAIMQSASDNLTDESLALMGIKRSDLTWEKTGADWQETYRASARAAIAALAHPADAVAKITEQMVKAGYARYVEIYEQASGPLLSGPDGLLAEIYRAMFRARAASTTAQP